MYIQCCDRNKVLFYSILFYSILFYSILFYSILFYSIIIANSTGESGVAGRELLANHIIRNEGVVITRTYLELTFCRAFN